MKTTTIDTAALAAILRRALTNEGKDGCCLPVLLKCHCWRCDARRALGEQNVTRPMWRDLSGFSRLPLCECGHDHMPTRNETGGVDGVVCGVNGCGCLRFPS